MRMPVFLLVLALLHIYVGRRIVDLGVPASLRSRRVFAWGLVSLTFALLLGSQFIYRKYQLPPDTPGLEYLSFLAYFLVGYLASVLCIMLPFDVLRLAVFVFGNVAYSVMRLLKRPISLTLAPSHPLWLRCCSIARWFVLVFAGIGALMGLYTVLIGPEVKQIRVVHSGLDPDLEGFKIVQITDLHIGPTVMRRDVEKIVAMVNAQSPDVIAFTGDLVDGFPAQLAKHTAPLAGLRAVHGVYAVTGNHEYYWGAREWVGEMERLGMKVLTDSHAIIPVRDGRLLLGGVPDQEAARFVSEHASDPAKSLLRAPLSHYKVLMAHRPASCFGAETAGYDLQLSGHTHGGQFIPWAVYVPFAHPYTRGLNRHGKMWVYVSNGTQYWGPPNRFGIPGEITVLTLSSRD